MVEYWFKNPNTEGGWGMNRHILLFLSFASLVLIFGCGSKVMVPPRIDLGEYGSVGLVNFTSNAEGNLAEYATQKFLEIVSESQPGARFIELGNQDEVLESVQKDKMDREAIQEIGKKNNLAAIILGELDVSDVKPKVRFGPPFTPISVEAEVDASMKAKMVAVEDGATVWTDSARDEETVAHVSIFRPGVFIFDAEDPDKAYGKLVESLVRDVSRDLRITYQ